MCIRVKVKENNNYCTCSWRGREAVHPVDQSRHHSIRIHEVPRRSRKRTDIHIMDCGLMFVNFDLIDSMGVKEEPLPENIPSSYGSPVSLDLPPSEDMRKRPLEIEDAVRPDKKLRLGRKTKNSGLRAERNRQSAAASRERSKRHLQELERLRDLLPSANQRIEKEVARLSQKNENCRRMHAENVLLQVKLDMEKRRIAEMEKTMDKRRSLQWLL